MQYMLILFEDEAIMNEAQAQDPAAFEAYMAPWMAYTGELQAAGAMVDGNPLGTSDTASTVSVRDGKRTIQDGPFIDTKEQLGGYYIINAESLDDAINWAEKCPAAKTGHVEIRPIADMG